MLKPTLQLKLGQTLTMTPQLQQAIRLLQLSTLELQTEVQTIIESNPMLEQDEGEQEPVEAREPEDNSGDEGAGGDAAPEVAARDERREVGVIRLVLGNRPRRDLEHRSLQIDVDFEITSRGIAALIRYDG